MVKLAPSDRAARAGAPIMPALEPARIVVDQGVLNVEADQQGSPPLTGPRIGVLDGKFVTRYSLPGSISRIFLRVILYFPV